MALLRRALISAQRAACFQQEGCLFSVQQALGQAGSWQQKRAFAQPAAQEDAAEPEEVPQKIKQLATDIMGLSILECSQLSNILREKLGIPKGAAAMPMMAMPAAMPAAAGPAAAEAAEAKEEKKEKTEFDVKLDSFTPEGKIKVIKEIRAITSLGLKEAKELVSARGNSNNCPIKSLTHG
jgi:large subunit ribosomal protein L7/L12